MSPVVASTSRTALESEMYKFPFWSTVKLSGWLNSAAVARPPSPVSPGVPLPATVVMIPVARSTHRTRLF
jgi:hypothetical protein